MIPYNNIGQINYLAGIDHCKLIFPFGMFLYKIVFFGAMHKKCLT